MVHIYGSLINYESDDSFEDYLKKLHIISIFEGVFLAFPEHAIKIVKFILYAYSIESEMLATQGGTWEKTVKKIYSKIGLNADSVDIGMILSNEKVRVSIQRFLQFQDEENFTQWCTYRDLRRQFLEAALFPLPKYQGVEAKDSEAYARMKSMIDAKMSAAENSRDLLKMMEDAKAAFIQNSDKLKDSVKAFHNNGKKNNTTSVEDFIV